MKFAEINTIYSQKVAEMISAGYTINSNTMGGSQGDIAAIDLRKGEDVIRVRLCRDLIHSYEDRVWGDCIVMTVGRCTDRRVIETTNYSYSLTIWNKDLEVIEERTFYMMGRSEWYIEGEEGLEARKKAGNRFGSQSEYHEDREFPGMERHMLPAIKRHLGKDRYPVSKIKKIYKQWSSLENKYCYYADLNSNRRYSIRFC